MERLTLDLLSCPQCQNELTLGGRLDERSVAEGSLACPRCERKYPIRSGIPHFISPDELEGLNRRFARFYDRLAGIEAIFDRLPLPTFGLDRKSRMEVLERLEMSGGRLLEVSIGSGGNLPYLFDSKDVGEVYGLDISGRQLTRCLSRLGARGLPVELFLGKAEALPFKSESFDNVLHVGGINFFSGKKKAIDEMIRVARPGSKIVIADESERVARSIASFLRLSRSNRGRAVDTSVPVHLVPETMEGVRVEGIWRRHGHDHGYCLEFRKPDE
jgi:ubiquinone/menaquinone biosynthesis C-methylase UbiE